MTENATSIAHVNAAPSSGTTLQQPTGHAAPLLASARQANRFIRGDCLYVLPQLPAACVDLVLTDPPYLVNYSSRDGRTLAGDDAIGDWLMPAFQAMARVLKPGCFCISFYGWSKVDIFMQAWRAAGFQPVGHFVFIKSYNSSNRKRLLRYFHEQAYLLAKGKPAQANYTLRDVLPFEYTGNQHHPTEKPLYPLRKLIGAFSNPGDLVLDPLAGSGSSLIAALQMGRQYLGCEKHPEYYRITKQRLLDEQARLSRQRPALGPVELIEAAAC